MPFHIVLICALFLFCPESLSATEEGSLAKGVWVQAFNFSLFALALFFLIRKPVQIFFHKRQEEFFSFEKQTAEVEKKRKTELASWGKKLSELEKQESHIQQKAQAEGERLDLQKKEQLKSLKVQLTREADFLLNREREKAKKELLKKWKAHLAQSVRQELGEQALSPELKAQQIQEFLNQMEGRL